MGDRDTFEVGMKFISHLFDKYITWHTGKSKEQRAWEEWYENNVNYRANTIEDMFKNFKHVIIVNTDKFTDPTWPFDWVPNPEASEYFWPQRPPETTCVWRFERVNPHSWKTGWEINGMGGQDLIFVATNSDEDAVMIALRWS